MVKDEGEKGYRILLRWIKWCSLMHVNVKWKGAKSLALILNRGFLC
jgi:hypothetical protein